MRLAMCLLGIAWFAGGVLLLPQAAQATPMLVRFSHVVTDDTPKGQMAKRFQELVAKRSAGRIRVDVFPDSQLYGDDDEFEALRLGAVDMLAPSLSKFGAIGIPEFEIFDLPFLFANLDQVRGVTQGPVGRQLLQRLARQQMVGLGFMDSGFKHMSASRPLKAVADYSGQRMRIQASQVLIGQMRALGAQPVVLPFGDMQRALAAGVVDGAENTLSNFWTQGLAKVQPDVTLTHHGYLGYAVVANQRFWASLGASDAKLLTDALNDALAAGNQLSAELDRQALAQLESGHQVRLHALSPAQQAALRKAVQPVYESFQRRFGLELLGNVQREVNTP